MFIIISIIYYYVNPHAEVLHELYRTTDSSNLSIPAVLINVT